jgi:hypothetical protein
MKITTRLAALTVPLVVAAAGAQSPGPVAVLAQPGLSGRFLALADGSVRVGAEGYTIAEGLQGEKGGDGSAAGVALSWLEPGVRVMKSMRVEHEWELATLSGAGAYGAVGEEGLWLLRTVRLTNQSKEKRQARLVVTVSRGEAVLKDDVALLEGDHVLLLLSRKPGEVLPAGNGAETALAYDLSLPGKGTDELLFAAPAAPTLYGSRGLPDPANLDAERELGRIAEWWRSRVLPSRLSLSNERVTEAFHAAVGSLLIEPPPEGDRDAAAVSLSALSRAGHGPERSRFVEELIAGQRDDGSFTGAGARGVQADLTTALADCALYSEAPDRWAHVLWRPIARSASALETAGPAAPDAGRVALALDRAADVVSAVGDASRAEELRSRARALAADGGAPTGPAASLFGARARALVLRLQNAQPPAVTEGTAATELLVGAYAAVMAGDTQQRRRAWDAVEAWLAAQPLPGVVMEGAQEDPGLAAQLILLIADSVARAEGEATHLLPALPLSWSKEGTLARLADFPTGSGALSLEVTAKQEGTVTLRIPKTPKLAQRLLVSPPLGLQVGSVRANGKAATTEVFEAGPPWALSTSVSTIVLSPRP